MGRQILSGKQLGRAGEGTVYEIQGEHNYAAKIYHIPTIERARKLTYMVDKKSDRLLRIAAWPIDTVHERPGGAVIGFLMPKVSHMDKIHDLYGVKSRLTKFPQANWKFLLHAADNLARLFSVMHEHGFILGDVNEGNVFVTPQATMMLLDCDSIQITTPQNQFLCEVGVEIYTPPELQGRSFRNITRTTDHDVFGLSILLFQLLFLGRHPFAGRHMGTGDMPIGKAISEYRFAYGNSAKTNLMLPPPASLPLSAVSPAIVKLFEQSFLRSNSTPSRPSPQIWAREIQILIQNLSVCSRHNGHQYWNGLSTCPWCSIEVAANILLFPIIPSTQPAFNNIDIDIIWKKINEIDAPMSLPPFPAITNKAVTPSVWAVQQRQQYSSGWSALTSVLGLNSIRSNARKRAANALNQANINRDSLQKRWQTEIANGNTSYRTKKQELEKKKNEYLGLNGLRSQKINQLENNRRKSQLHLFLDKFNIWHANISGIGPTRKSTLQSYGIETAADINENDILNVPGFGVSYTEKLLRWRRDHERKFVFNPTQSIAASEIAHVDGEILVSRRRLEQELQYGLGHLQQISQEINRIRRSMIEESEKNLLTLAQAEADLHFL